MRLAPPLERRDLRRTSAALAALAPARYVTNLVALGGGACAPHTHLAMRVVLATSHLSNHHAALAASLPTHLRALAAHVLIN